MHKNPLLAIDFYKVDHRRQYPEGTTEIYSNFTPRHVNLCHSLLNDFQNQVVVFGIQGFIVDYLIDTWNVFFENPPELFIEPYKKIVEQSLGIEDFDCSHFYQLHKLGYLPIRIKAIDEGMRVPLGVPVLTIVNTHPDFFWLTNFLESIISTSLWKPMTVASIAFEMRRVISDYALKTGSDESFIPYQAHDFSFRGMSGWEDATICAAAHLTSFSGTDCASSIDYINQFYGGKPYSRLQILGNSVPATEHSVMTCNGVDGEYDTIKRLITEVYPDGIVSIVCDSYDLWRVLNVYLPSMYGTIDQRPGKVVIRPDSGNPFAIICGDMHAIPGSPAHKGSLQLLWENFGGTINAAGYKELNPRIGLIYGDAITVQTAKAILAKMAEMKFASSNIVFGMGSFSYQYITRDTFGFAMKATSAVIGGIRRDLFKDPITAGGKKTSAKGLLSVDVDVEACRFYLKEQVSEEEEGEGALETVFENGKLMKNTNIDNIRRNLELEHYLTLSQI